MLASVVLVGFLVGAQEPARAGAEPLPTSLRAADFVAEFDRESTCPALGLASDLPAPVFTSVSLTPAGGVSASATPIPVMRIAESASINTHHVRRATFTMDVYGQDRPRALLPLYISNVVLGIADVATSAPAIQQGSRETNPVMARLDGSPWKMATVRMVGVGVTIWCVEAFRKRGHGRAAVIAMLAINAANVAIVAHNSTVLGNATRLTGP